MRASVAKRIAYGFDATSSTAIQPHAGPAMRLARNQTATAVPTMHTPDNARTAQSPAPNTPVHTCNSR